MAQPMKNLKCTVCGKPVTKEQTQMINMRGTVIKATHAACR